MEIKFENVSYSYKKVNYSEKKVLENINIELKKGKVNAIIGKSGSGKTTLLELIEHLLIPTEGQIRIDDYILSSKDKVKNIDKLRFNIGYVSQFPEEQFFSSSVKEELELPLRFFNYKLEQLDKRIKDVLKMVSLNENILKENIFNLSNGEKRKLAIATALIINPKVLILDEPTIGLDSKNKNDLIKLIRILKNRFNKTIIIVSHDIEFIHKITDYIYVLNNKKIVLEGTKYEVFKQEKLLRRYGIVVPKVIEFSNKVLNKKNIKIGYRDDINDLIKDIYRYAK